MKRITRYIIAAAILLIAAGASAQDDKSGSSGIVRRGTAKKEATQADPSTRVTGRMQQRFEPGGTVSDADMEWMRIIYRSLDLERPANTPLYYPVEPIDGEENLFRIIVRLLADNSLPVYEFLDGREVFTDKYRLKSRDIFDNFQIAYTEAKGSTEKNPKFVIEESDVPANEVLSYYIIERWEFDRRNNRLRSRIEALCPVLHRVQDYGVEAAKYPLCWIRYDDLRPFLMNRSIFMSDDNNLPAGSYDDYFQLGKYEGEIYKTRNLRNRTMAEIYPDPDDLKRAQDSIQQSLDSFDKKLWVPTLDELHAARDSREQLAAAADTTAAAAADQPKSRTRAASRNRSAGASKAKPKKVKKASKPKSSGAAASSSATRSVRNRKR